MKVLGVCGAQGALLYKFRKSLIGNIEPRAVFHTAREDQWKLNFNSIPFVRTVKELSSEVKLSDVDIILGSPSCGHSSKFSYSRKKSLGIPKEDPTLNLFIDCLQQIKPKMFAMENLPKLLDFIPINEWEELLPEYDIVAHTHSVSRFGNSQITRVRLLLVGVKKGTSWHKKINIKKVFKVRNTLKSTKQLEEFIRPEYNYVEDSSKTLSMYHYSDKSKRSLTVEEVRKLWQREFKLEDRWPMYGHKMKTLPGVYRNVSSKPPKTLRPSNRQFDHKGRIMGVEWYRVIMGFPKSYKVYFDSKNPTYYLNKIRNAYTKGAVFECGTFLFRLLKNSGVN